MSNRPDDSGTKKTDDAVPIEMIRRHLTRILKDNNVGTGTGVRVPTVTVTGNQDRRTLQAFHEQLRTRDSGEAKVSDWMALGDGLCAAGCFREASDALARAADLARNDRDDDTRSAALFKRFRAACELARWDEALLAYREAIKLAPDVYELFDASRYEIVSILGAGGFGTVFCCKDTLADGHEVAVKALHDVEQVRDPVELFAEARLLKQLAHPGIIGIEHWDFADRRGRRRPYLVLEYFPGRSLESHLAQHGPLAVSDAVTVGHQIADALQAAHDKGVLHRDIKPGNILVRRSAKGWEVRIVDFGLAVPLNAVRASLAVPTGQRSLRDNAIAGTMKYAPPEQRGERSEPVGRYSDIYSFGKTFVEMLLGLTEPVSEDWKTLPAESREPLRDLLEKCIHSVPNRRHASFAPLVEGLSERTLRQRTAPEPRRDRDEPDQQRRLAESEAARRRAEAETEQLRQEANAARRSRPAESIPTVIAVSEAAECAVTIRRTVQLVGCAVSFAIAVDGQNKGSLWVGQSLELLLSPGKHRISASCLYGVVSTSVEIVVREGQQREIELSVGGLFSWPILKPK